MKKVLFFNPPGDKIYLRQYYCSQTSKANYIYHLVDFNILGGILHGHFDIEYLDAIVSNYNLKTCLDKISKIDIDYIIFLTGHVSCDSDFKIMEMIKVLKNVPIIAIGDVVLSKAEELLLENQFLDAAIMDFTSPDILDYLKGNLGKVSTMFYKRGRDLIRPLTKEHNRIFSIPIPRHDLGIQFNYRHPFVKRYPFVTVLTDYGCPFKCTFCIYATFKYKYRSVSEVIEELKYIKELNIRDVFFLDQTFGSIRTRCIDLCRGMLENNLNFDWFCFSRVDVLDYDLLYLMKRAGCHTIMFGVESANSNLLKAYNKGYDHEKIKDTFKTAQRLGIKTMGTFILGLPEEDKESILKTIEFSKELNCDYASFNFAVPREGTELRRKAIEKGLITEDNQKMDQSGSFITLDTTTLTKEEIIKLRKKAYRSFYLRPVYLFKRLTSIGSITQLKVQLKDGLKIIQNIVLEELFKEKV
ncbi:MAG TPA: B12-binding domain-containing radical SAM protein [Candidatus Wunengus sp. YC65]|uniref:B12-binding domain-containing radical SAM protein n=1 Tax=Candidatus Wunengus sp. YC65 TaxID=3367701 RepID=UPI004025F3DA